MKFSELDAHAKDTARTLWVAKDYPEDSWWDRVFEDAVTIAEILGIKIDEREDRPRLVSSTGFEPNIAFSGFGSQGDGASFTGEYRWADDAIGKIQQHAPHDAELLRIASELTALQIARRLQGHPPIHANITKSGLGLSRYCHARTMVIEIDDDDSPDVTHEAAVITRLMRAFADWIYKQLEAENDYRHSDECIAEALADEEFDEHGSMI